MSLKSSNTTDWMLELYNYAKVHWYTLASYLPSIVLPQNARNAWEVMNWWRGVGEDEEVKKLSADALASVQECQNQSRTSNGWCFKGKWWWSCSKARTLKTLKPKDTLDIDGGYDGKYKGSGKRTVESSLKLSLTLYLYAWRCKTWCDVVVKPSRRWFDGRWEGFRKKEGHLI
jgi:hypothetical protein